jgi:hypothetical protein
MRNSGRADFAGEMLMEMRLRIMKSIASPESYFPEITVRLVPEMGGQPLILGNEAKAVMGAKTGNISGSKGEPGSFLKNSPLYADRLLRRRKFLPASLPTTVP